MVCCMCYRIAKSLLHSLAHYDKYTVGNMTSTTDGNQVTSSDPNKPFHEENDFSDLCNCSTILGNFYRRKTRVRPPMLPADLSHDFSKPMTIYSEVLYEDLDDTEKYYERLSSNNKYKLSLTTQ